MDGEPGPVRNYERMMSGSIGIFDDDVVIRQSPDGNLPVLKFENRRLPLFGVDE
ncbi:MAG: hypothetical protein QME69_03730 [Candidatus Saccharicenans sp.]|nr:hypothetical protein [Candidatus Saccharicenans sp.]